MVAGERPSISRGAIRSHCRRAACPAQPEAIDELCRIRIATDGGFPCTALIDEGGRVSSVTPGTYWIAVGEPWNVVRGTELTVREISS